MSLLVDSTISENCTPIVAIAAKDLHAYLTSTSEPTRAWIAATGFVAKQHTHTLVPNINGGMAKVLLGVSGADDIYAYSHLPLALPQTTQYCLADNSSISEAGAALGWQLGAYQFNRYKEPKRAPATLVVARSPEVARAQQTYAAIALARDLINTPTEDMGPQHLADVARQLANEFGATFNEWVGEDLLTHHFPAIHAVGRASHRPPRLIELQWGEERNPHVAIIGKGVCFDTGGLNIKGADSMRWMKKDMGGAAHALALAQLIMATNLPVRLHMLIPAVENAIAGNAYRPGEVVTTRKGPSIEIGNTDAEGRVVLADALAFAAEFKPELIIDFATLTGAARVALGPELPATFCNNEAWFQKFNTASVGEQDPIWRMPLWQNYNAMIDSHIADLNNTGGPQAGAITAALFLEHFIPKNQAWLHIDVFAWNAKSKPGRPEGGEAQSLRAAFAMLEQMTGSV